MLHEVAAKHTPPLQTRPGPQLAPASGTAVSMHVEAPVRHEVLPTLQGSGLFVHARSATQATQPPPLQTMSVPQLRPLVAFAALSTQVAAPVEQEVTPALHRVGLTEQAFPSVQSRQAPFLQTWLLPHAVPSAALTESMHLCAPVAHEVVPILQTVGLVEQLIAAAQLTQRADALQTRSVPQLVPASACVVASTQAAEPPAHDSVPSRQGAPGFVAQRWPATHPRQVP